MSASHEWNEWHLTPRGWEAGSSCVDFAGVTEVPPPADRVLTKRHVEHLSSAFSKMDVYWEDTWRGPDEAAVAQLLAQYGDVAKK